MIAALSVARLAPRARARAKTEPSAGKRERWDALCSLLEIDKACDGAIRYQLFHRTASALIEARRFFAIGAAVVVHSFSRTNDSFTDFQRFVALLGADVKRPGEMVSVKPREGIHLAFGWAQGHGFPGGVLY